MAASSAASELPQANSMFMQLLWGLYIAAAMQLLFMACKAAYEIRMYAIEDYGRVIHEFDPYFNYRATEYLWQHGAKKFFQWFDYQSWYPLGRPVGTTIYPGMQFTSVAVKMYLLPDWSINDICCFLPAWFGSLATLTTAALAYTTIQSSAKAEKTSVFQDIPVISTIYNGVVLPIGRAMLRFVETITGSRFGFPTVRNPPSIECAIFTAGIMAIVPAHLMRSVGGGYDNESVATTAMQLTFWLWTWTVSADKKYAVTLGWLAGLAYFYMVTSWGGYIFVINLIGVHAAYLLLTRKMDWMHLYQAYSTFYLVGTILATRLPVVGWAPLKSLEQLGPCAVFVGMQVLQLMRVLEIKYKKVNKWTVRVYVIMAFVAAAAPVIFYLFSRGYFGPLSARVRGLFVEHTKTGNPLVDSVAEHQAASPQAYYQYLHNVCYLAPVGYAVVALYACTPASSFLLLYGAAAYFFSHKMVRLILLTAPIASVCGGIALGYAWAWIAGALFGDERPSLSSFFVEDEEEDGQITSTVTLQATPEVESTKGGKKGKKKEATAKAQKADDNDVPPPPPKRGEPLWSRGIRLAIGAYAIQQVIPIGQEFYNRCDELAHMLSHPTIITRGSRQNGEEVVVDDYREAYWWLRDNTPEDARVMAWWDYGYQITGIANRTTIADGNTWNHEHIALLGRALTSPEKDGHRIARHLADYVLIWAGGGGDDLAKSPHLIRIANSVYRGMCKEPTCRTFGMHQNRQPSKQLGESLLYKLHSHGLVPGVEADKNRFKEVFRSMYGKVRIFKVLSVSKESKEWVEKNRICDAPGSWYCPGQYPPALQKILKEKRDFAQLEDFNYKGEKDSDYTKQYFENLNKKGGSRESPRPPKPEMKTLDAATIDMINEEWENNEFTTMMWEIISQGQFAELTSVLREHPELAHIRSEDGRGPMWWAYEYQKPKVVSLLKKLGVSDERTDANGVKAIDLKK